MVIKKAYYGKKFAYRCFYAGKLVWDYGVYTGGQARGAWRGIATPKVEALSAIQMHTTATLTGMAMAEVHEVVPVTAHAEASIIGEAFPRVAETVHGVCVASANLRAMGAPSTYGHVFTSGQAEAELAAQALPHAVETVHGVGNVEAELAAVLCPTAEDVQQILAVADATIMASAAPQSQEPERILATVTAKLIATGCPITLPVHTVTFVNNGVELYKASVIEGYNCSNPVTAGEIKVPTKEMTPQYTYDYSGWTRTEGGEADADALTNITADTVIYAAFTATVRKYTITYYDDDGVTVLSAQPLAYGDKPSYVPTKSGYAFDDWYPEVVPVTGNASYYASWVEKVSFASADWATIAELSESGNASRHFAVGDTKTFTCNGYILTAQIVALNTDPLADGSGKAGITCVTTDLYPVTVAHDTKGTSNITVYPWSGSTLRSYCNGTVYNGIQEDLRTVIKQVTKYTRGDGQEATNDYCWALSSKEVGSSVAYESNAPAYSAMFYDYSSRIRKYSGTANAWNLRSVQGAKLSYFVSTTGKVTYGTQTVKRYFLFGFCI